ncbi:hypothetical protein E3P81_03520 [Wallemia ichthyophaga]|nr:hypothetical protein E3P97_03557 [Wallemia ichthyophaga]TIB29071.1 hypothetical protein E3P85_03344 [Wallemia ichthyophaga]TIB44476.1 hypothetical protein E3P82_03525 [Wallemia ichthyophaga]TIB46801.1 hypothetical protein E3P81_03520 [Wallemia ichthyophaga]TIB49590.1 hypothetical protein E3P80_03529 [Wallemia ichthyophaga]
MAVVSGGLAYGVGSLAKRYLWPHLQPPSSTQYESDLKSLNDKYDEAESTMKELRDDTTAIKDSLTGQQDKVNETIVEIERAVDGIKSSEKRTREEMDGVVRELSEIKSQIPKLVESQQQSQASTLNELQSELKSLKSLLLSRQNGGTTSPSSSIQIGKPQIPATELLTSRKDGYALVWIAATLPSKANLTNFKRLSKKDILNFSVPAFCQTLQDPPEPLALRLSSSLLIGVVRIYDKRLMFFEHDVQQVHNNLLKAINNTEMSSDGESINLLQHRARVDQITLDANQLHAPDNIQNLDLRLQLAEIDVTAGMTNALQDSNIASLTAFDSHSSGIGRADPTQQDLLFDPMMPMMPMDWSISSHAPLGADIPANVAQSASQQFLQDRPPSRQIAAGFDDWGMPSEDIRRDFFEDIAQNVREEGLGDNFFNFDISLEGVTAQSVEERRRSREQGSQPISSSPLSSLLQAARPNKRRRLAVDSRLDLLDEELRGSRDNYLQNMERDNTAAGHRNSIYQEETLACNMVISLPFNIARNMELGGNFPDPKTITRWRRKEKGGAEGGAPGTKETTPMIGAGSGMVSSGHGVDYQFDVPMDPLQLPADVEVGRAVTGSPRSALPWERSDVGLDVDRPSTASPSAASLHRSVSMVSEGRRFSLDPIGSTQRRQSIRSPVGGSVVGGDVSMGIDHGSFAGLDEAFLPEAELDNQTNSFLRFAKGVFGSNGGTGQVDERSSVRCLVMNDICPATLTARYVAVNAFHNILVLADKNLVKVHVKDDPTRWSLSFA